MAVFHKGAAATAIAALTCFSFIPLTAAALPATQVDASEVAGTQPSTDSPALVSENASPQVETGAEGDGTVTLAPEARPGFRILPYVQRPGAQEMTVNFFTETGTQATVVVQGPGLAAEGQTFTVDGEQNPATAYQHSELALGDLIQAGNEDGSQVELTTPLTVPQGAWIRANEPFKYSVRITDLEPNSSYTYTVTVDGYEHNATFTTNPTSGGGVTEPIHLIAFSDTETDPVGRVTYREWVKGPLAEGSEERPDPLNSAWAQKFGNDNRDGETQLRYMLTEDQAQKLNNEFIAAADPDLLLIPGDIAERASWQTHWDEWFRHFAGDEASILDGIPTITSLGNHEVYGYCASPEDCTDVIRARANYNWYFDTHGSSNPEARDAYHRTDYGPVTIISVDSTNGTDQAPDTVPDAMKISGNDAELTPEQYGTDTQNAFTIDQYQRDFPQTVADGWWGEDADPNAPDQPNFMPGSAQYQWLENELADARAAGQIIVVQWHHVAYSNGTHGTTMGHEHTDSQPGTPMRHLQPLLEKYDVASVFSGHDETFQASYVDEAGDGTGVYHWDVGVASDGLRGEKMIPDPDNPEGPYIPLDFNTHSVWMAQRDSLEKWETNAHGVKHLVSGGKHYGHLDIAIEPYSGAPLPSGVMPSSVMTMTPQAMFPILDDNYDLKDVELRAMTEGTQVVYFDESGRVLNGTADAAPAEPTETPATEEPTETPATDEPTETPATDEPTETPATDEPTETPATDEPTETPSTVQSASEQPAGDKQDSDDDKGSLASTGFALMSAAAVGALLLAGGIALAVTRRKQA